VGTNGKRAADSFHLYSLTILYRLLEALLSQDKMLPEKANNTIKAFQSLFTIQGGVRTNAVKPFSEQLRRNHDTRSTLLRMTVYGILNRSYYKIVPFRLIVIHTYHMFQ